MKKILWISPYSLHDTSSGAAVQCRLMLEKLAERSQGQIQVVALGSFIFDNPCGASMFTDLKEKLAGKELYFNLTDRHVQYIYVRNHNTNVDEQTGGEQRIFFQKFIELINNFKPDLVMGYGGDMLSMTMRAEAHRRGIPVIYTLWNGNHKGFTFPDCDMVLTDSHGNADFYAKNFGINVQAGGIFIDPAHVVAEKREPRYITMINPVAEKGIGIFARLALMAQKELPNEKFLVVESRGSFAEGLAKLHQFTGKKTKKEIHPFEAKMFPNVDVAQHTNEIKQVYAITKALIAPSLWFEGWGRVTTEAVMNGIPVLASKSGGLQEAVSEGGICFDAPIECQRDYNYIPSEEEVRPWMDALKQMLNEDYTERCQKAAAHHSPDNSADRVLALIKPLLDYSASTRSQFLRSGMLFR